MSGFHGDWSERAARVGRAVARFRLAGRPEMRAWEARRIAEGGGHCFGCDETFRPGETHVEVVVAQTLLMELHEDCFDAWKRFAVRRPAGNDAPPGPAEDDD